jgi:hypothetical protein
MAKFKVGDRVRALSQSHGWAGVKVGDIGTVCHVFAGESKYDVNFQAMDAWTGEEECFEMVTKPKGGKKMAKKKLSADVEKRVQKAIAWLVAQTPTAKERKKTEPKPEPFESKLARKIEIEAGCKEGVVRKIFTDMLGVKIVRARDPHTGDEGIKVKVGTVVVSLSNTNDNDYTIGEPCMVLDVNDRQAVQMTGDLGNHLPGDTLADGYIADCRYATRYEIESFVRSEAVMRFLDL